MYILLIIFGREKYPIVCTNSVGLFYITSIAQLVIIDVALTFTMCRCSHTKSFIIKCD